MMRHETAGRWLRVACGVTASVGVGVAALAFEGAASATSFLAELVFAEPGIEATPMSRLMAGVVGGVLAGWAVTMWQVVDRLHASDPATVRAILVPGLVVWFVIDGVGSVVSGGALNVVGNLVFAAMFGVPLVLARSDVAGYRV